MLLSFFLKNKLHYTQNMSSIIDLTGDDDDGTSTGVHTYDIRDEHNLPCRILKHSRRIREGFL